MTPEQVLIFTLALSILSAVIAFASYIAARRAAVHARQSVTTAILLDLHKEYSTPQMLEAVTYIYKLKSEHRAAFSDNPYRFAREYIAKTEPTSPEYSKRRMVSHFYSHLANLLYLGLIDRKAVFALWDEGDMAILEILEPIEAAIAERYYSSHLEGEWPALRMLSDAKRWNKNQRRWWRRWRHRVDPRFKVPRNPELYALSRQGLATAAEKEEPANKANG